MERFAPRHREGWTATHRPFAEPIVDSADAFAVGIDLGTTNSVIAMWSPEEKCVEVFALDGDAQEILPSIVSVAAGTRGLAGCSVGVATSGSTVVRNVKRLMGRRFDDPRVRADVRRGGLLSCPIAADGDGDAAVQLGSGGALVSPAEVSSHVLRRLLAAAATARSGRAVTHAVITVPAHFNVAQRRATRHAAELAGVEVLQLLNEPSAAAMSYGLFVAGEKRVLIVDLGGGTFDVSLLDVADGKVTVVAVGGDSRLGGVDITENFVDIALDRMGLPRGSAAAPLAADLCRALSDACEQAKVELAASTSVEIPITPPIAAALHAHALRVPTTWTLSRDDLAEACDPVLNACMGIVDQVLTESGVAAEEIKEIVLVGGSSRLLELRSRLVDRFDGKELCTSVQPDLAVAEGAAIQAAILSGADQAVLRDVLMLDVLPMSIGVLNASDEVEVVLARNTSLPARATRFYTTAVDNQPGITVDVYEVDDTHIVENGNGNGNASDRVWMGYFNFSIPKQKRGAAGTVGVDVCFELSGSGVLKVTRAKTAGGEGDDGDENAEEEPSLLLPIFLVIMLFVLYIVIKLRFHDPLINGPSSEGKKAWLEL